ncbi:plasmid replication DNA-binding protein [Acinetobacter terrae]|uniref:DNA-binding protein n=1 Tax=Acinetobacter terrae TaxID=2731247 RepID=A0ABX1V2R3_9GAMM|nr:plasmid replication DNA-binding protein [Acinetobacter terrae]NNH87945.1 DNA-binding protein [Acinetobacter terrae]
MKSLSVIELSNLYGMTRQAVYKQINKGNLSKNSDGKIDLSEAIRVFGEPSRHVNGSQTTETRKLSEVHLLEQQVHMLQKQLEQAHEREQFQRDELKAKNDQLHVKDEQIEAIQRLLEAPKPNITQPSEPETAQSSSTMEIKEEVIVIPPKESEVIENKRIPVPEHVEPEPQKRGFLSRFFLPNG